MCSCVTSDIVIADKVQAGESWYNKLGIFKYAGCLQVQDRWKQDVPAVTDDVTNWELPRTLKS